MWLKKNPILCHKKIRMSYFKQFLYSKRKKTHQIESCFSNLNQKVLLCEKQYRLTKNFYGIEWKKEVAKLKEQYDFNMEKADEIYKEVYNNLEGEDEELKHSIAMRNSEMDYVDGWYSNESNNIKFYYTSFFDIYSKSVVMTLYSLLEGTMKEICQIVQNDLNKKIGSSDLASKNYILNSFNYLFLVVDLPDTTLKPLIKKLEKFQIVRNKIAHGNSEVTSKEIEDIIKNSNGSLSIEEENKVRFLKIVHSRYIFGFIKLIREIFEELFWLLDERYENKFLLKGLDYWFGMLDEKIKISHLEISKIKKGVRKIKFIINSRKQKIKKFNCRITISRNKNNEIEFIEQTNLLAVKDFNQEVESSDSFIFDYIFPYFNQSSQKTKIELLTFPID